MGGLGRALPWLLAPAVLMAAGDPAPAEVSCVAPNGAKAILRLIFKKGIQVESKGLPPRFLVKTAGTRSLVSFDELSPAGKQWVLSAIFPQDEWGQDGVLHRVRWPQLESVWLMASHFTGHGQNYDKLQAANPGKPEKLGKGDVWRIPRALLSVDLGGASRGVLDRRQPEDDLDDEAKVAAYRALLSFEEDSDGKYAAYHLRKGEALYSSVVIRYTDRVDPKEVTDVALAIARRSGIPDVRGIQPGQLIKIPLSYLADPFQPEGSKALEEERQIRKEVRHTARVDAGPRLKGVRIVLDAGHGGIDVGAMANQVWESDFVYDIAMRVRRILEQDTEAVVSSTIRYPGVGFRVRDRIATPTREAEILTTPPLANDGDSPNAMSVHLRWVLANDLFASFARKRGEFPKTLFISFHADSLHPSARGSMVYVPGATYVPLSFALSPARTGRVAEARRGAKVQQTEKERLQSEARSRVFAETLLTALKASDLPVHSNRPIRNVIHRAGKSYVPAVIRHCAASTRVLVEVANLTNEDDAANLKDPAFRERYAEALVDGIRAYFKN